MRTDCRRCSHACLKARSHMPFFSPCPFLGPLLFSMVSMKNGRNGCRTCFTHPHRLLCNPKNGPFNGLKTACVNGPLLKLHTYFWNNLKMCFT